MMAPGQYRLPREAEQAAVRRAVADVRRTGRCIIDSRYRYMTEMALQLAGYRITYRRIDHPVSVIYARMTRRERLRRAILRALGRIAGGPRRGAPTRVPEWLRAAAVIFLWSLAWGLALVWAAGR